MQKEPIYICIQPEAKNSYWANLINDGIFEAANEKQDTLLRIAPDDLSYDIVSRHIPVVGNNIEWMETASTQLMRRGAFPMIVNACMLPISETRYSGVTFEIEEMIKHCVDLLSYDGKDKTVLLGVNPVSLTDRVKANAFSRAVEDKVPDIKWSDGKLEDCVSEFIENFSPDRYDAAICANDTVAIRLILKLNEIGYKIPNDLYVIGMGNSNIGANLSPKLTSVMFDYREMGKMAMTLYRNLNKCKTECRMNISLPCRLVIRESAPLNERICESAVGQVKLPCQAYFDGDEVQNIIVIEDILQSLDVFDREILFGVSLEESCEYIADRLGFSDRAVRYRLANIIRISGFENRNNLEKAVRKALGREKIIGEKNGKI